MKRHFFLVMVSLCVVFSSAVPSRADTFCADPDAQKEWAEAVAKYPGDNLVQTLHALWIGLCAKVKAGDIDLERANELFERARAAAIEQRKRDNEVEQKGKKAGI